jgi:hypothetical protein
MPSSSLRRRGRRNTPRRQSTQTLTSLPLDSHITISLPTSTRTPRSHPINPLHTAPRTHNHPLNLPPQLRHPLERRLRKHVPEIGKSMLLSPSQLVHAPDQLDELARVDIRIAPVLDVVDERVGDARCGAGVGA